MEFTSTVFDIEHLPGARMPADFLSRIVDKEDSTAPDLEDDSHLVFALTSDDVSQQDTAQFVRPSGNPDRKAPHMYNNFNKLSRPGQTRACVKVLDAHQYFRYLI